MSTGRDPEREQMGGASGGDPIQEAREPTEEELRAAYEGQIKQLRVEHVVLETIVTLANLGMRRTGLAPGTEDERDPEQVRVAIESVRALLPVLEPLAPQQVPAIRDALSQLQLAYVRIGGEPIPAAAGEGGGDPAPGPGSPDAGRGGEAAPPPSETPPGAQREEPGPAQRSGRLWVPGQ